MIEKCICETGELRLSDNNSIEISYEYGKWWVSLGDEWGYDGAAYGPIFYCPICGREL